ncbi:MAG: hypothetical protein ABIN18_05605 [Pseudomonadota bacterium]
MIGLLSPMAGMAAGGAGGGGGISLPSSATSSLSDRSPINIAPVGFNLGAIMQPMMEGSPENGGFGVSFMNRYSGSSAGTLSAGTLGATSILPYVLIGGAALVALFFLVR